MNRSEMTKTRASAAAMKLITNTEMVMDNISGYKTPVKPMKASAISPAIISVMPGP